MNSPGSHRIWWTKHNRYTNWQGSKLGPLLAQPFCLPESADVRKSDNCVTIQNSAILTQSGCKICCLRHRQEYQPPALLQIITSGIVCAAYIPRHQRYLAGVSRKVVTRLGCSHCIGVRNHALLTQALTAQLGLSTYNHLSTRLSACCAQGIKQAYHDGIAGLRTSGHVCNKSLRPSRSVQHTAMAGSGLQ